MISESELLEHFKGERRERDGWMVLCPAHEDREPSLHITRAEGRWLLHCHAGCNFKSVLAAAGLEFRELFERRQRREIVATYDYTDEAGKLLFQAVRYVPKDFRQRRPSGNGDWIWNLDGTRRVTYRLAKVIEAVKQRIPIYVVEGERDVHAIERAGGVATCNPMGAGKWRAEYAEPLRGAEVVVVADRDEEGAKHAAEVVASLEGKVENVTLVEPAEGKDAADHLAAGHGLEDFREAGDEVPDGAELLAEVAAHIRRYVVMTPAQAGATTLWTAHTHCIEAVDVTAYLAVESAEKRSGKTRTQDVLELLVADPWRAILPSEAVVFRKIAADRPTLLLDEVDAIFNKRSEQYEGLRGILNAGHQRGATVPRCVGEGMRIRDFETFCPKCIAGIGRLPDTIADRSIRIRLKRRKPSERVAKFRRREVGPVSERLRQRLEAFAKANIDALRVARPEIPEELDDRAADGWEPLLAIADLVGGVWPEFARRCAKELSRQDAEESAGLELLADVQSIFARKRTDRIHTKALVEELIALPESRWKEWGRQENPITDRGVGRLLAQYEIKSRSIEIDGVNLKGYTRDRFEDAWHRYLSPTPRSGDPERQNVKTALASHKRPASERQREVPLTDKRTPQTALKSHFDALTARNAEKGSGGGLDGLIGAPDAGPVKRDPEVEKLERMAAETRRRLEENDDPAGAKGDAR